MRGKPRRTSCDHLTLRIIPAHAGQTWYRSPRPIDAADHPRACGANIMVNSYDHTNNGSSPRMRGKRPQNSRRIRKRRIIPAHAGQTDAWFDRLTTDTDHPRACGANQTEQRTDDYDGGSSPRMRGKLVFRGEVKTRHRIIPAHAGQTGRAAAVPDTSPDHPRACGANEYAPV